MVAALRDAQTLQRGGVKLACGEERAAVVACYKENASDPFQCHDVVRTFMRCSDLATSEVRGQAGKPQVGDLSRLRGEFPSLGASGRSK